MNILDFQIDSIPVQPVNDPVLAAFGVSLSVLRCDLIHPQISGNKWFKLKYNLLAAQQQGHNTLLSFGGAWSNHIHALSAAGKLFGFRTIGVIRGELEENLTPCLQEAVDNGMTLLGISRALYRDKNKPEMIAKLHDELGGFFVIPEGGANGEGVKGCAEMLDVEHINEFDTVCLACGTGTTLAGLLTSTKQKTLGFQVLKGQGYLKQEVDKIISQFALQALGTWSINENYHFGGYARSKPELLRFITKFQGVTGIPLEPVYSGKMLFGIYDLIQQGHFSPGTKILAVHGGGLQGQRGFTVR